MLKTIPTIGKQLFQVSKFDILKFNRHPNIIACRYFGQPVPVTHPHLISNGEVTPGLTKTEYLCRRVSLVDRALKLYKDVTKASSHIFIIPASSTVYMTYDIPYVFRQNSDFLYLCGFQEPDSVLVLETGNSTANNHTSTLFVPHKDVLKEMWDGPRSGTAGALTVTGVDETYNISELDNFLQTFSKSKSGYILWYNFENSASLSTQNSVVQSLMTEPKHRNLENPLHLCHELRSVKSPAEMELMRMTCEIASQSFIDVMKFSKPGVNESALYAKIDFECRMREAELLAYPPVVAGGPRANIIHYVNNNQVIYDGEMVLMDAGCEYHGYTSDITRTWPVSGKFSPAQKELYNAVLFVQLSCIQLCTGQYSLDQILHAMLKLLGVKLQELAIIDPKLKAHDLVKATRKFCPHHVSHYLGMDVHDTGFISRSRNLQPGMIVTIEPGVYINTADDSVPAKFRGIGIRIEDDILVTETKPIVLTASCPKTVEDIENVMQNKAP